MITFRQPTIDDALQMVAFYNIVGGETSYLSFEKNEYPLSVEDQAKSIQSMNGQLNCKMILAMDHDEIIGIGTITSSQKIKSRHQGELGIVVKKAYHGRGIGSQIIQQLIDWAKSNGVTTRIQLDTRCDNVGAVELYKKFGFEIEGRLKNATLLNGAYYDLYVMGLLI
ncbi:MULTISPECIES: GNAT family N-acetyltransferase [Bacillus]|uniref:GNAT family N-acetyltransferase n=1 Tax=Bacillus TaxID=1386 RepID=UPI0002D3F4DD|nr:MULTISPECIES: GNAT family protein [Bacillus]